MYILIYVHWLLPIISFSGLYEALKILKNEKNTYLTNSRHVLTYLGSYQSNAMILNHVTWNFQTKIG